METDLWMRFILESWRDGAGIGRLLDSGLANCVLGYSISGFRDFSNNIVSSLSYRHRGGGTVRSFLIFFIQFYSRKPAVGIGQRENIRRFCSAEFHFSMERQAATESRRSWKSASDGGPGKGGGGQRNEQFLESLPWYEASESSFSIFPGVVC